jgi:hypothetical protein
MGLYRDETGRVFNLDDKFAEARGYSPLDPTEEAQIYTEKALRDQEAERGALGTFNAAGTGFLSGATLGGSDYLLSAGMTDDERARLQQDIEAHPIARTGGEIGGAIAASMEGVPRTPTGYLSSLAARETEQGLAQGGLRGTARALNAMGAEGAVQSAGQYIGHSAIENKEVTAEGVAGALGTGYAFGAGGGGAVLGVSKGTVAARRLFSRVMDGQTAAKDAASAWSLAREEALQADKATEQTLQTRLDAIQEAKREALKYRNETKSMTQEERIRASAVTSEAGPAGETSVSQTSSVRPEDIGPQPLDADVTPAKGGGQTSIFKKPEGAPFDEAAANMFDEGLPTARDQVNEVASTIEKPAEGEGKGTGVFKRPTEGPGGTKVLKRGDVEGAPTALEEQLAGTKAKLDEGAPLKDVKASKGNESDSIERWISEKGAHDAELSQIKRVEDIKGLADIRHRATSDLLSPEIADEEAKIIEARDELQAAREAMQRVEAKVAGPATDGGITDEQLKALRQDNPTNAGKPSGQRKQIMEQLDTAHEEALMNAHTSGDGRWLERAQQVEDMMFNLPAEKDIYWNLGDDIQVVERYEKAVAKAADTAGDAAHPSAQGMRDGLRDAESDAERKVFDRTTRAVDDADMHGPTYKTPKERVQYARERQLEAQRNYDSLQGQEADVGADLKKTTKKVKAGEREKKGILRAEAKAARGSGIPEKLGILEVLDLPGMPKVSDLPVVGPLLGAWLKFRTLKAALGRKMGVVSATGDARAAILASRTRDRIARAVDRSLGVAERGSRYIARKTPAVAAILSNRIYDDGLPDAPLGAPIQTQAATRIRELAAYVNTPNAIEMDVRRQLKDVTDPDLIAAAEQHRRAMMEYMLKTAPKAPEQGMMKTVNWQPSPAESMSLARRWDALNDPAATWERFEQEHAMISLEAADALRNVYPQLFSQAQQRVMQQITDNQTTTKVPYKTRVSMSLFYQIPLDSALEPENLKITQSVYERKPSSPAYNPSAPGAAPAPAPTAQPAIANPVNLSQAYTPTIDRR